MIMYSKQLYQRMYRGSHLRPDLSVGRMCAAAAECVTGRNEKSQLLPKHPRNPNGTKPRQVATFQGPGL